MIQHVWPDAEKHIRRPNGRNAYFKKTLIMTLTGRIFKKSFHQNSRLYAAIEGIHPLIEEILRFGFIDMRSIPQSVQCECIKPLQIEVY